MPWEREKTRVYRKQWCDMKNNVFRINLIKAGIGDAWKRDYNEWTYASKCQRSGGMASKANEMIVIEKYASENSNLFRYHIKNWPMGPTSKCTFLNRNTSFCIIFNSIRHPKRIISAKSINTWHISSAFNFATHPRQIIFKHKIIANRWKFSPWTILQNRRC